MLNGVSMARQIGKLNPRTIAGSLSPGRYSDGGNLYLLVEKGGAKRWLFIFRHGGRQQEMGLGPLSGVPLAKARERAAEARQMLAEGVNPLEQRQLERAIPTFGEMAEEVIAAASAGCSNAKHAKQWGATLRTHAKPLWNMSVKSITTQHVLDALKPIWGRIPETADRTRQRIERVLDAAEAKGFRPSGMRNPASWRGNLQHLLPPRRGLIRGHHPAMPYDDVPALMEALRYAPCMSSWALRFTILTAARTTEVRKATWDEFDLKTAVWTIPADRVKARRPHRVPLTTEAVSILRTIQDFSKSPFVFTGHKDKPLSGMAMTMLMRGLEDHYMLQDGRLRPATVHGFRSSFRDWVGTCTEYPRELAEEALSHTVGNAVERAYRRQDALERRRPMMDDWAAHLDSSRRSAERAAA